MTQLSDDCFAAGEELMTTEEALRALAARVHPLTAAETVPLRHANRRILAEDVVAPGDVPPHDNSAVDGYAVFFDDLDPGGDTRLPVTGRIAAGHALDREARRGEALRVFTGGAMPPGPDTILMQEDCRVEGDDVVIPAGIARGANRRRRGEDIGAGTTILRAGHRLRPQDLGLAAATGRTDLAVRVRLRAAIFSTGDELRDPGQDLPLGAIFDSNRTVLAALLEGLGCIVTDLGILADRADAVREALADAAGKHDLLFTSGGVSVGDEDHVKAVVEALGSMHFWRLAIRPGRPLAMGQIGHVPFVGLPGNPVAAMVTFLRFARPLVLALAGCGDTEPTLYRVRAGFGYAKKGGRREWLRSRLERGEDGALTAHKFARDGAGILTSMVESDGLIELAEDITQLREGDMVDFLPFAELL